MSSTYSSSLRIELIGTGDQAGTWGNTTNTNLGTLMEAGICGYTSVSVIAADQALTALNGAPDQSRNAVLALTTSTGANFAVYAPPAEKTYVIYNASSYTATIYNSTVLGNTTAAGTGVAIPAGKTIAVWSDGTNFAVQVNYLTGATLAGTTTATTVNATTITASNAIAESSGGTGESTYTNGQLLIGNAAGGLTKATLTAGSGISVTNGDGTITLANTSASPIPSGSVMLFVQTSAPTGWTKSTSHDNKALRVVSGTASSGGSVGFTTAFGTPSVSGTVSGTVGSTTLTTTQMPSHGHSMTLNLGGTSSLTPSQSTSTTAGSYTTGSTGGNGSHDHSFSGSFSSGTATINVQYVDVIICTKD